LQANNLTSLSPYATGINTIWVFCGIFAEEGYHPMYTPNIYNVEEDNALSLGLQTPTTGSVLKIRYIFVLSQTM
jgi:hypothetical protein